MPSPGEAVVLRSRSMSSFALLVPWSVWTEMAESSFQSQVIVIILLHTGSMPYVFIGLQCSEPISVSP